MLSKDGAEYMCVDIKNFYLGTPLNRYEITRTPLAFSPKHTIKQYDLRKHENNDFVYVEIRKSIYVLPQAGELVNNLLKERMAPA